PPPGSTLFPYTTLFRSFELFRVFGVPEEVRMQLCIGTSLAIIVPTTLRSYRAHLARGLVIPYVLQSWAVPAIVGVALGSLAAALDRKSTRLNSSHVEIS